MSIARIGPVPKRVVLDGAVLGWTAVLSVVTGIVFGLAPALHASRVDLNRTLKEGGLQTGGGRQRFRGFLITAEVALSVMLLTGAGLMVRSFLALRCQDLGFDPHNVIVINTALTGRSFDTVAGISSMVQKTEERLQAIPGVEAVSAEDSVPLVPNLSRAFLIAGRPAGSAWRAVTTRYFNVFRIPVIEGRGFRPSDNAHSSRVVVINQAMARRYWPNENPIGRVLEFTGPSDLHEPGSEVVGVVADAREVDLKDPPYPVVYVPLDQVDDRFLASMRIWIQSLSWTVRTKEAPTRLFAAIRREVLDTAGLPVGNMRPMDEIVASSRSQDASQTALLGAFALIALLLASVGLHGVLSYSAQQRRLEFAIRVALGASPSDLGRMVLWQGIKYSGTGTFIGIGAALGLTRLMRALLFGVNASDPLVFAAVPLLLGSVALLASYAPTRRVSAIDPAAVMRCE